MTVNGNNSGQPDRGNADALPAAWRDFIRFCRELKFGEIEMLKIQDGVPVCAEQTTRKIRFGA